jgi:hypothetical protein
MELLKSFNLGIRFLLELCLLVALGFSSYHLFNDQAIKWLAVLGLPILAAVIWGTLIAPKSQYLLDQPLRLLVELILFGLTSVLLYKAGFSTLAVMFIAIVIVNEFLLYIWRQ